jgi:hypothetical protein
MAPISTETTTQATQPATLKLRSEEAYPELSTKGVSRCTTVAASFVPVRRSPPTRTSLLYHAPPADPG